MPGACLCVAHYLELVSSSRNLPDTPNAFRNRRFFHLITCYLVPFLYMTFRTFKVYSTLDSLVDHLKDIIVQDHRFDLVQGVGCVASIHPSAAASMMVWLPQVLMCILSLVLHGEYHVYRKHLDASSHLLRQELLFIILVAILSLIFLFILNLVPR